MFATVDVDVPSSARPPLCEAWLPAYTLQVYFLYHEIRVRPPEERSKQSEAWGRLEQAQDLWNDPDLIEIPARTIDEPRFLVVGRIKGKFWSGVITYRDDRIRITLCADPVKRR